MLGRRRWPEVAHVDLLAPARRVWSAALGDCRLSTLERDVWAIVREDDVPGWEIPARFFAYLRDRQPGRLRPVFAHNRDDVLSLVALLGWFTETLVGERPARPRGARGPRPTLGAGGCRAKRRLLSCGARRRSRRPLRPLGAIEARLVGEAPGALGGRVCPVGGRHACRGVRSAAVGGTGQVSRAPAPGRGGGARAGAVRPGSRAERPRIGAGRRGIRRIGWIASSVAWPGAPEHPRRPPGSQSKYRGAPRLRRVATSTGAWGARSRPPMLLIDREVTTWSTWASGTDAGAGREGGGRGLGRVDPMTRRQAQAVEVF